MAGAQGVGCLGPEITMGIIQGMSGYQSLSNFLPSPTTILQMGSHHYIKEKEREMTEDRGKREEEIRYACHWRRKRQEQVQEGAVSVPVSPTACPAHCSQSFLFLTSPICLSPFPSFLLCMSSICLFFPEVCLSEGKQAVRSRERFTEGGGVPSCCLGSEGSAWSVHAFMGMPAAVSQEV